MALPVAIQLYSLRDEIDKDFYGTLKAVKEMGYDGVEFAGLGGNTPAQVKAWCEELGLTPVSAHVCIESFFPENCKSTLEEYSALGVKFIAYPYLDEKRRPGGPKFDHAIEVMTDAGKMAKEYGIRMLYHNHNFEFDTKIDGQYGIDVLYARVPEESLASELDVCWVNIGGEIPAEFIKHFPGRAPVVHLKDFYMTGVLPKHLYALIGIPEEESEKEEATFEFRPVGHGMQDIPAILESAKSVGTEWVVVEQDDPSAGTTPLECAKKSIDYLRSFQW